MYAQLAYGMRFLALNVIDTCCFNWHGIRPVAWQRQLMQHRLRAPHNCFRYGGTNKEQVELKRAQALYPDRFMYLGIGSEYSPWIGSRMCHRVKVLVTDHMGTPPVNKYGDANCWGMEWGCFLETEWVKKKNQTFMR